MKNSDLIHKFSNGFREDTTVGNVSIRGGVLFSYELPVCKLIGKVHVVHDASNSQTTNRHVSQLRSALSHQTYIRVPNIDSLEDSKRQIDIQIEISLAQAATAKSRRSAILSDLADKIEHFNAFALILNRPNEAFDIEKILATDLTELARLQKAAQKEAAELKATKQKANASRLASNLDDWRNHSYIGYGLRDLPCALRLSKDRTWVETSHGATVRVAFAQRLWTAIQRRQAPSEGLMVDHYRLTSISPSGDIVVGCHQVSYAELAAIAAELELV